MSFDAIPGLLADVLQEQRNTNEVLTRLVEAIAGLRARAAKTQGAAPSPEQAIVAVDATAATTLTIPAEPVPDLPVPLDYKSDVAPTFAKLLSAKGAPAVVAVLTQFGVKKGAELAPGQLADALAAATSALAA